MLEQTSFVFMHLPNGPVPAGRLRMVTDGRNSYAAFAYGTRYLCRADAVAVDPEVLPLEGPTGEILTGEGFDLFNGIRDAAPDSWGRFLMRKAAAGRELSEFDHLVASGEHRVGALAFGPPPSGLNRRSLVRPPPTIARSTLQPLPEPQAMPRPAKLPMRPYVRFSPQARRLAARVRRRPWLRMAAGGWRSFRRRRTVMTFRAPNTPRCRWPERAASTCPT
ncbi:hypothetical protein [Polymorphobacter megasporae]|uniref:hypothetical protein n=1 Tax=Glacieibacterium megasporae TaxID=2835787 RepID=UPI0021056434|nr:hypothetical protein [Polymorphobacter megasporae]